MKLLKLLGTVFVASFLIAVPIGCAGTNQIAGAPQVSHAGGAVQSQIRGATGHRAKRQVLVFGSYSLNGSVGKEPDSGLIAIGSMLYAATTSGGPNGGGSVFAISYQLSPTSVTMLHALGQGPSDGYDAETALLPKGQWLYGTSWQGGANTFGTVFRLKTTGAPSYSYSTRWSFGAGVDGKQPEGTLINLNGKLWGTTLSGGNGYGTIFYMPNSSSVSVCYPFNGFDGWQPIGSLTKVNGFIYGTTTRGGSYNEGTIFKIDPTNCSQLVWVYSFGSQPGDGGYPNGGLIKVSNRLYGTTQGGGANGLGTIFSINVSGATPVEQPIYSFQTGGTNGFTPFAPVIANGNTLYGTTGYGGSFACPTNGCGTVFQYTLPSGPTSYATIHVFGSTDGAYPEGTLVLDPYDGGIYGTTRDGGANDLGTVFDLTCPTCQ